MTSKYQLSEGALETIMNGGDVQEPIMQVLGSKKINSNSTDKERYRLLLSDGKYTISFAMLTTQINDKLGLQATQNYSVIKLKRYITNLINSSGKGDTRILLILDMNLVAEGELVNGVLGSPLPLIEGSSPQLASRDTRTNTHRGVISPIVSLSPFHNNWIIKARVTNKTGIRTWSNSRGEGKLFTVDLLDESGEIRCAIFQDLVDKFFNFIEVDRVYFIGKAFLKPTNKQFCTMNCAFEMTLTNESIVEESTDNNAEIPHLKYDFTTIDKVAAMEAGTLVDLMGVCTSASDLQIFTSKSTLRELRKKEIVLVDQSQTAISLTLWGLEAEAFDASNNPVVVIKSAKIGEFAGSKHLTSVMSTQLKINPDIPQSYRLKGWYELEGNQIEMRNVSERGVGALHATWMTFKQVQEEGFGRSEKGDYYQTLGTVLLTRSDRMIYKACPLPDCNKKAIDMENGMFRCEKCNREYLDFKYRLLVSMNVGDSSGNQWVTLFSSEAEKILGKTSHEIGLAIEEDSDNAAKIFEDVDFKQFIFKCRVKMENYNDEQRLKTVVIKVNPINYEEYNTHLVERIGKFIPGFDFSG